MRAGTNCVVATSTRDDKFSATYRRKVTDDLNFNVGYTFSARRTSFDENARAAMIDTGASGGPALTISGLNAGDYRGFHSFFLSSRNQNMLKGGVNWQATDKLSFNAGARYTDDDYLSTLGVQKGKSWSVDLDTTYIYREQGALTAYVTLQERTRDVTDQQANAAANATTIYRAGRSHLEQQSAGHRHDRRPQRQAGRTDGRQPRPRRRLDLFARKKRLLHAA